jgi:uncharacterized protein (TIGR02246 family)
MTVLVVAATAMGMASGEARAQAARPEDLVDLFAKAWNAHSIAGFESLFTEDADWVTTFDSRADGRATILADLKEVHEGWAKESSVTISKTVVRLVSPDVAVVHYNAELNPGPGEATVGRTMLIVAVKKGKEWKISAGQIAKPNCLE